MSVPALPAPLLKAWSRLIHWTLITLTMGWLLCLFAWAGLHWGIVPRIGEFRAALEQQATQTLGVRVRIGQLQAVSSDLLTTLALREVVLLDDQGREALWLPQVQVTVSVRSLLRRGLEQLVIDAPKIDVRRSEDGSVWVAGLNLADSGNADRQALDWLLAQPEIVVRDGVVRWTDERRGTAPLVLQKIRAVLRNRGRHHDVRIDATPPSAWGDGFVLMARVVQPLLAPASQWERWDGRMYAEFSRLDVSAVRRYADLGFDLQEGLGAWRAWAELRQGGVRALDADLALTQAQATLGPTLQPLRLQRLTTRLSLQRLASEWQFSTQGLTFLTDGGQSWPAGDVRLNVHTRTDGASDGGSLQADLLDLQVLAQLADRLPLAPDLRRGLQQLAPRGRVIALTGRWSGPPTDPRDYAFRGRLSDLSWQGLGATQADRAVPPEAESSVASTLPDWLPGAQALSVDFDFNAQGGKARLAIVNGSITLPGWFDEPTIAVDRFDGHLQWQRRGDDWQVALRDARLSNADAHGRAEVRWRTADPAQALSGQRYPGVLDLRAELNDADVRQVARYLPATIDTAARDYVRAALQAGRASKVIFEIRGDIDRLPDIAPQLGRFRISAEVQQARMAYVPPLLQAAGEASWPVLNDLAGSVLIDRLSLLVKAQHARWGEDAKLRITRAEVSIRDLTHTTVDVKMGLRGPLGDVLRQVDASPVRELTRSALSQAQASGMADVALNMRIPIADLGHTTLSGRVNLLGNEIRVVPQSPLLSGVRGAVLFNQSGFSLQGVSARMLGGDVALEGGLVFDAANDDRRNPPTRIEARGQVSAEGLARAPELGFAAELARELRGSTAYTASLSWLEGAPILMIDSPLTGVSSQLPAPLNKPAHAPWPLHLRIVPSRLERSGEAARGSVVALALEDRLNLGLVFSDPDRGGNMTRGALVLGPGPELRFPDQGLGVILNVPSLNVDAWEPVLSRWSGLGAMRSSDFTPRQLAAQIDRLQWAGHELRQLVLGAHQNDGLWRGNLHADSANGYFEYWAPRDATGAGRLYMRLARLALAAQNAQDVEQWLDRQPSSIPALDVVVDDFQLRGKSLGHLELEAINRNNPDMLPAGVQDEWRISRLNLTLPQARLTATGNWTRPALSGPAAPRRTALKFRLEIADSGALLSQLGMPGVVRQAQGVLQGQIAWQGPPMRLHYPSMSGALSVDMAAGQFLKADPGLTKLLGVLNLQALPRRLALDFRDVFSEGFAFDSLRGDIGLDHGLAVTRNLQMKGVNAAVLMEGQADLARETQDLRVVVVPEINAGTASLLATLVNPALGLGSVLAQLVLRGPLIAANTQEFHIDGPWTDPQVTRVPQKTQPPAEPAAVGAPTPADCAGNQGPGC
ncbi:MAG: YhdP family protein [Rhodoferax sp.]